MVSSIKKIIIFILASAIILISISITPVQAAGYEGSGATCSLSRCIGNSLNQVFPFDIFSGIPEDGDLECPQFTIFNRSFEFCLFLDAIAVLKYPIIIGLLVKVYLFS